MYCKYTEIRTFNLATGFDVAECAQFRGHETSVHVPSPQIYRGCTCPDALWPATLPLKYEATRQAKLEVAGG